MKLSEFIFETIDKIEKIDRNKFTPYASVWLDKTTDILPSCGCLAGALAFVEEWNYNPLDFFSGLSEEQRNITNALDNIRKGYWVAASDFLNTDFPLSALNDFRWYPAQTDFAGWDEFDEHLQSLEKIASQLHEKDL